MFDLTPFRRNRKIYCHYLIGWKNFMQNLGFQLSDFRTDIIDKGDRFILEAELPGFDKGDINISVDGNRLTIIAEHSESKEESKNNYIRKERKYGSFTRSFDVSNIKTEKIEADYKNGVLTLDLPKKDGKSPGSRRIDIR